MILEPRQQKRFHKLYDQLSEWVARELGIVGEDDQTPRHLTDSEVLEVNVGIWGEDGDRTLIDRFVATNPVGLNRADVREVESWKSGVCVDFAVTRIGRDVLFLLGKHAFAVRGLTREIDIIAEELPAIVQTAIIPFDGLITYADVLSISEVYMPDGVIASIEHDAESCAREGRLARSARDFAAMMPLAAQEQKEEMQRLAAEKADGATNENLDDPAMDEDAQDQHQHKGALAGLTWEEREAAIDEIASNYRPSPQVEAVIRSQIEEWCDRGKVARTLEDAYSNLSKEELLQSAKNRHLRGNLKSMSKKQLVKAVVSFREITAQDVLDRAIAEGAYQVEHLRVVWEAGGMLRIPCKNVHVLNDVPMPCFPSTLLFHKGEDYIVSMPKEVYDALEGVDWKQGLETARGIDRAMRYLDAMVDFRGVVPLEEGISELNSQFPNVDAQLMYLTIVARLKNERLALEIVTNRRDETFFVDLDIADKSCVSRDGVATDERLIQSIRRQQSTKPVRRLDGFPPKTYVLDYMRKKSSFRELTAYLDAHVPDSANDYSFADRAMEDFVYYARESVAIDKLFGVLEGLGFVPTIEQVHELMNLFQAFLNDVPVWTNNGWSANEIAFM